MNHNITNIKDIKAEIRRLKLLRTEQENYLSDQYFLLKHQVEKPVRIFNSVFSSIPGVDMAKELFRSNAENGTKADWVTKALRLGTPFLLNRTLLRRAGWLKKLIVMTLSEGAISGMNKNFFTNLIEKFKPKKKKIKKKMTADPIDWEQEGIG